MIVIGLTGGIGSGKSTVSSYMTTLGIPVFDADASSRAAVKKGNPCLQKIVAFFGPECLLPDGELNRPWVADKVFHDKTILKQYEKIVQDQVWAEAQQFLAEERKKNTAAVVLDVPLLIECGWHTSSDTAGHAAGRSYGRSGNGPDQRPDVTGGQRKVRGCGH